MNDTETANDDVEQFGWAVWLKADRDKECVSVLASDEETAETFARKESDIDPERVRIDGPFQNTQLGYYEFEYITEHRERVIVEAPTEDYAKESADAKRNYRGEYVQTVHTETTHQPKDTDQYREHDRDGPDYETEKQICHSLGEFAADVPGQNTTQEAESR